MDEWWWEGLLLKGENDEKQEGWKIEQTQKQFICISTTTWLWLWAQKEAFRNKSWVEFCTTKGAVFQWLVSCLCQDHSKLEKEITWELGPPSLFGSQNYYTCLWDEWDCLRGLRFFINFFPFGGRWWYW